MKEQEILRAILREERIGWWTADMARGRMCFSDTARELLGLESSETGFDRFREMVAPAYRDYAFVEVRSEEHRMPEERIYPVRTRDGEVWIGWRLLAVEKNDDGSLLLAGSLRKIDTPDGAACVSETARINDLLYRLNSISHTLLSLLHTDRVDEAIDKILSDILTMFRGGRAYLIEFDWERRMHRCTYEVTAREVSSEREMINQFSMDDLSWWTECVSQGQTLALSSLDELPAEAAREREVLEAQGIKSLIVMPLASRDRVWGYAGIDIVEEHRKWTNEDCQWFSSLINIINLCIELRRSERTAQEDRSYLQSLYRHMPLGYVRFEMHYDDEGNPDDYRIADSNYAADAIFDTPRERYVGRMASELGIDYRSNLPVMMQVLRTGEYVASDSRLPATDRSIHTILYTTRRHEIICLVSDTTEVLRAHEAIYRNEKLLRNIFDNIQVGVEIYDREGRMTDLNNKDMDIFGVREKKDVLGINFFENPNIPEAVREGVRRGEDQAFRIDYPFDQLKGYYSTKKTGLLEIFSTASMLYDMQGRLVNFILINIDNTEINRAHSRLAEFESSFSLVSRFGKVGYCRFDLMTRDGYGVPQWYRNLGEREDTPLREVIGVYAHVDPTDRAAVLECIRRVRAGEIDHFGLDLRINPGPDESWTRINVMRNPLNNDPAKIEMVCVNYDITELKQTERNLIEAKNKAEVSDRLKSAFLANMSHEIRTPLNAIVGFSNLIAESDDPGERREYMRIVQENNEMLLKLISDILDLSKIEAGTFDFRYGEIDVHRMCREIVLSLGIKVQGRNVELRFDDRTPDCRIVSDKSRLMQVLTNFINNALKFTQSGSVTLGYTPAADEITFYVADTGAGIPEKDQPTIFERFVKLNTFVQGTGLGLSISKSIVEQMGGRIGVESAEGQGSRFWFTIPLVEASGRSEEVGRQQPQQPAIREGRRPVLLIAEDTDSNFLLLSLLLRREYDIERARDGEEAVRLFREVRPDLILMDIKMPGMDGLEATRRIRLEDARIPIIATTAFAYDRDRQRAMDAGCTDYLSKPIANEPLQEMLRKYIEI